MSNVPKTRQAMTSVIAGSVAIGVDAPEGAIAQLGERVLCKHEVVGSIPSGSTRMPSASEDQSLPLRHRVLRPVVRHREEVI